MSLFMRKKTANEINFLKLTERTNYWERLHRQATPNPAHWHWALAQHSRAALSAICFYIWCEIQCKGGTWGIIPKHSFVLFLSFSRLEWKLLRVFNSIFMTRVVGDLPRISYHQWKKTVMHYRYEKTTTHKDATNILVSPLKSCYLSSFIARVDSSP